MVDVPDVDPVQVAASLHEQGRIRILVGRSEHADKADLAVWRCPKGLLQGAEATGFDDVTGPFAPSLFKDGLVPAWRVLIIDRGVGRQRLGGEERVPGRLAGTGQRAAEQGPEDLTVRGW
jgi:hypothetical protein